MAARSHLPARRDEARPRRLRLDLPLVSRRGGDHRRAERDLPAAPRRAEIAVHGLARLLRSAVPRRRNAAPRRPLQLGFPDRLVLVCARRRPCRSRGRSRPLRAVRDERRRRLLAARRPANRPALGRADRDRHTRNRLPRDRRARAAGAATRHARRACADDGALARGGLAPARRVGARPLLADGRLPGRDPARLERRHPGLPLGREGAAGARCVLLAAGLRRARAAARRRDPACSRTAVRAAATSSPAAPTT